MNLVELLENNGRNLPGDTAIIDGGAEISFPELWSLSRSMADDFRARGISKGWMVGVNLADGILYIAATVALWRLEAIAVPIPVEMQAAEASELARRMQLFALVAAAGSGDPQVLPGQGYSVSILDGETRCDMHGVNAAFVRFTSGTTGRSRGVVLSHETIRDRLAATRRNFNIGAGDTVMWCLSMAHHFVSTILLYLWAGAKIVIVRNIPDLGALTREHCGTLIYAAPFHFELLAGNASREDLSTLRLAFSTTAALPKATFDDVNARLGVPLRQVYGIIEVGLPCANIDDPVARWDSVGKASPGYEVRLANREAYKDIGDNCGEVEVKGPGFFDAYYDPWVPAAKVLKRGWFHTGDIGQIDRDGFLFLRSRTNGVINISGMKVFPEEVEGVLNTHPAVKESRVYPRSHAHLGQIVEADVVLRGTGEPAGEDDLRMYCRERLSSYKVPNAIHFVSAFPRTSVTGKIRRVD